MRDELTPRQREIAALVAEGLTSAEIAVRLGVASGTVNNHIARSLRVLRLRNRAQLAVWAVLHGPSPPPRPGPPSSPA